MRPQSTTDPTNSANPGNLPARCLQSGRRPRALQFKQLGGRSPKVSLTRLRRARTAAMDRVFVSMARCFAEQARVAALASDRAAAELRVAAEMAERCVAELLANAADDACAAAGASAAPAGATADLVHDDSAAFQAASTTTTASARSALATPCRAASPVAAVAAAPAVQTGFAAASPPAVFDALATLPAETVPRAPPAVALRASSAAPWSRVPAAAQSSNFSKSAFPALTSGSAPRKVRFRSAEPARQLNGSRAARITQAARAPDDEPSVAELADGCAPADGMELAAGVSPAAQPLDPVIPSAAAELRDCPAAASKIELRDVVLDLLRFRTTWRVTPRHAVYTVTRRGDGFQALLTIAGWLGGGKYAGNVCDAADAAVQSCAELAAACIRADALPFPPEEAFSSPSEPNSNSAFAAPVGLVPARPCSWMACGAQAARARRSRPASRGRLSLQRSADDDMTWETGHEPPYYVATSGHLAGYKVHVGDLQSQPFARLCLWVRGALGRAGCRDPGDYGPMLALSDFERGQLILTFVQFADAQIACRVLDSQLLPDGKRSNARFWVPKGYDPQISDPRFRRGR